MTELVQQALTEEMIDFLQGEKLIVLSTIDHESGAPNVSCISWLVAASAHELRFAIDPRSRIISNIDKNPSCTLTLIGLGSCYAIAGQAHSDVQQLPGVSIKMTQVVVMVQDVRDVMFYGSKITQEPAYIKTYNEELAKKLDDAVYTALRKE
ncbi:MAG: hypothetical protein JWN30_307 [Bacilli bacterium]|nr:hypothetical protein [Bacilli bacterium]